MSLLKAIAVSPGARAARASDGGYCHRRRRRFVHSRFVHEISNLLIVMTTRCFDGGSILTKRRPCCYHEPCECLRRLRSFLGLSPPGSPRPLSAPRRAAHLSLSRLATLAMPAASSHFLAAAGDSKQGQDLSLFAYALSHPPRHHRHRQFTTTIVNSSFSHPRY